MVGNTLNMLETKYIFILLPASVLLLVEIYSVYRKRKKNDCAFLIHDLLVVYRKKNVGINKTANSCRKK